MACLLVVGWWAVGDGVAAEASKLACFACVMQVWSS